MKTGQKVNSPQNSLKEAVIIFHSQKAIKVNVDILECLSILLSNTIQIEYFELPTNEIRVLDWRLVGRSTVY